MGEREILEHLDRYVWSAVRIGHLDAAIRRVTSSLAGDGRLRLAWEPVPLIDDTRLTEGIRSAWVFVLRRGTTTGAERHPNSIQRVMSYRGGADLQTWEDGGWKPNLLSSHTGNSLEDRWLSIPANVWHRPVIPAVADWLVVSFHTAPADALIEERAMDDEHPDGGVAASHLYAGRHARS